MIFFVARKRSIFVRKMLGIDNLCTRNIVGYEIYRTNIVTFGLKYERRGEIESFPYICDSYPFLSCPGVSSLPQPYTCMHAGSYTKQGPHPNGFRRRSQRFVGSIICFYTKLRYTSGNHESHKQRDSKGRRHQRRSLRQVLLAKLLF